MLLVVIVLVRIVMAMVTVTVVSVDIRVYYMIVTSMFFVALGGPGHVGVRIITSRTERS